MIAEVAIVGVTVIACYAMRLRVAWLDREAQRAAEQATLRLSAYDDRIAKTEREISLLHDEHARLRASATQQALRR